MATLKTTRATWALAACVFVTLPAAAENYQTNLGPIPLDGSNRANVMGRGSALATLDGNSFTVHGTFSGLASPATAAHLNMGMVMGGTGATIHDVTVTPAQSGQLSGRVALAPDEVAALKAGKIYLLLDSQKAAKGNLWGWFQPAHKSPRPNEPEHDTWYIPNIIQDSPTGKKPQG
jgi:hypothetical protein